MAMPPFDSPLSTLTRSLTLLSLLLINLSSFTSLVASHFEGFNVDYQDDSLESLLFSHLQSLPPLTRSESHPPPPPPAPWTRSEAHPPPPAPWTDPKSNRYSDLPSPHQCPPRPYYTSFDFWDDDDFEEESESHPPPPPPPPAPKSYTVEIACLILLAICGCQIYFFAGKRENKKIANAWAAICRGMPG